MKGAVCSNVIGVVERSHYSDKNRRKKKQKLHLADICSLTPLLSMIHLSLWFPAYQSFCLRVLRPSSSVGSFHFIICLFFFPTFWSSAPSCFHSSTFSRLSLRATLLKSRVFHSPLTYYDALLSPHTFLLRVVRTWKG